MREYDGSIDDEGMCELESGEIRVEGMTDENCSGIQYLNQFLLDIC